MSYSSKHLKRRNSPVWHRKYRSHRVAKIRCPTPGHWYAALPDGPTSGFCRNSPEHCVWSGMWNYSAPLSDASRHGKPAAPASRRTCPTPATKRYLSAFFFRNSLVLMAPGANTSGRRVYRRFSLLVVELFSGIPAISKGILRVAQNSMAAHSRMNLSFCSRLMIRALR